MAARLSLALVLARPLGRQGAVAGLHSLRTVPAARAFAVGRKQGKPSPSLMVRAMSTDLVATIKTKNAENPCIVYSKTYCPYCSEVKGLLERLGVEHKVVELDSLADGAAVQDALEKVTGRSTVPQVFVGGQHVGGCDDTLAAEASGELARLLEGAGLRPKAS